MHLGCMTTLAIGANGPGSVVWAAPLRLQAASERTTTNRTRIRIVSSSSRAELVLQRQLPDSLAGHSEDRVGQRGRGDRRTRLADPAGLLAISHQMHFDSRRLVDPQRANVMEVGLLHPAVLERHLAPQGAADPENDPALDLRFHRVRVD